MSKDSDFQKQRMDIYRAELIERMNRAVPEDDVIEVLPGLFMARSSAITQQFHTVYPTAFCVIAQGCKTVLLNDEVFRYDPGHYLISTLELPVTSQVAEASEEKPYLSFRINLEPSMVASVMMESRLKIKRSAVNVKAMDVSPIDADLLDAVVRLARLLEIPEQAKILAPLIIREIVYRLLNGEQGARLTHLLMNEGDTKRISKAVKQLRENFDKPLVIENMARELGMSVSGFHHHFKSVTAMSPLQFQKQLRLQEARQLMLGENLDAANAGFRVGYDDPSYFSREYKKHFGAPPKQDIAKLRNGV